MKQPLVSIILPTYKEARFLNRAIKSVCAQEYENWELLIIDDGLTPRIVALIEKFKESDTRIRFYKNEKNRGIQKSLNRGLNEAQGKYIARIDDDDQWVRGDKLMTQVDFLENNNDYVLVGTGGIIVDEEGCELARDILPQTDRDIRKSFLSKNCFLHSSVLFRKQSALDEGGYSESRSVRHVEDYALWLALGLQGKVANIPLYAVSLTVGTTTLTYKNRLIQAKRSLALVWKYRYFYPSFAKGYCIAFIRLVFFGVQKILPFSPKIIHTIKRIYRKV